MIWKTSHLTVAVKQDCQWIADYAQEQYLDTAVTRQDTYRIAIVGGGPKGLYALDHLLWEMERDAPGIPVEVLWFNGDVEYGSGPNYQVDQPEYLLINYCIGNVDAWNRESPYNGKKLNLEEWISRYNCTDKPVVATDFASRAVVGHYLQAVARQVILSASANVRLYLIAKIVENIQPVSKNRLLINSSEQAWEVDNVMLSTGHCYRNKALVMPTSERLCSRYLKNVYPVTQLNDIPPKSPVGIIGMGLTFIDVALHLTEGRGGVFDDEGGYLPSENEPVIYPFSRNMLPILPRGPVYGPNKYRLRYLDKVWIGHMSEIRCIRQIDFSEEIYPVLDREVCFAYYSTLLRTRDDEKIAAYITNLPDGERFGLHQLLYPSIGKEGNPQQRFINYLEEMIVEAERGELDSPLMAAAAVWREATPIIGELYKNGGFTGNSQRMLDKELFSAFCRTSFGPPIANMKKICALAKQGVIQLPFESPVEVLADDDEATFVLRSSDVVQKVDYLLDARIGRPDLGGENSRLYAQLRSNALLVPFVNDTYQPGCPRMDASGRTVIDGDKYPLYFYGSNTEGVLLDNDSLSRTKNNLAKEWAKSTVQLMKGKYMLADNFTPVR